MSESMNCLMPGNFIVIRINRFIAVAVEALLHENRPHALNVSLTDFFIHELKRLGLVRSNGSLRVLMMMIPVSKSATQPK